MKPGGDAVERELSALGAAVEKHLLELTHDIWQLLTSDIPELRGDDIVEKLLDASVQENVATLLHMFEHGLVPEDIQAPAAAVECEGVTRSSLTCAAFVAEFITASGVLDENESSRGDPGIAAVPDLDERLVDRRVKDRSLGRRHERLRQHRHDPVHLRK
jgi:hypothetical protein